MRARALIVDDDESIARSIEHIVKALPKPHDCDWVGDIATARKRVLARKFDYLVLDMNLPLEPGRATGRRENGRNLLEWIRSKPRLKDLPVIVVTGEDKGESDFILSVMRIGGMDRTRYLQKPIDGDKLEKEVRDLLTNADKPTEYRRREYETLAPKPEPTDTPAEFACGVLEFENDGVYLRVDRGRIKVLGDSGVGHCRRTMQILRERDGKRFVRMGVGKLAHLLGNVGAGVVTGAAKTIRNNIRKRLKRELNVECQNDDVLVNDRTHGYHFNDSKISICIIGETGATQPAQASAARRQPASPAAERKPQ